MAPDPRSYFLHATWLEPESLTYPSGGFLRRARVVVRKNNQDPAPLPLAYGQLRIVKLHGPARAAEH